MIYDSTIEACRELLENHPAAQQARMYADSRLSRAAQQRFGFGWYPDNQNISALLQSVPEDDLIKNKLRYPKIGNDGVQRQIMHNTFEHHNLIMPYRDLYGEIVSIVGRTILPELEQKSLSIPKYRNTSFDKGNHLFGLYEAKQSIINNNSVVVVEGQFDCIQASSAGIESVVALGSSSMTLYQLGLLLRYTDNIYLFLDNDEAGLAGAEKILKRFDRHAKIKQCRVPSGYKDLDEFVRDNPTVDLEWLISIA